MTDLTCSIVGCDRPPRSSKQTICLYHYAKNRNEGAEITYSAAHVEVFKARGLARRYPCIGCGTTDGSRDWSYDHRCPNELVSRGGAHYSSDPEQYSPRCKSCHKRFDVKHRRDAGIPELQALATELEPEIRNAIAERKAARDPDSKEFWDSELDRLSALLLSLSGADA